MRRIAAGELLDDDRGTRREVAESLADIWTMNRWFGGVSGSVRLLRLFFERTGLGAARVLDVGCGDARMAADLQERLRRHGFSAKLFVLDRRLSHLESHPGKLNGLIPLIGNALELPLAPGSVDVVMCNLFLHHFCGESAQRLLQELSSVAARAVLINDLERHGLAYFISHCFGPFFRSPLSRHDGPASVR